MNVFTITDHADQQFGTIINGSRVSLRLRYNPSNDRWSFDLALDDKPVLQGRRVVTGIDLIAPFDLNIGVLVAIAVSAGVPDRSALPSGGVRIFHMTALEFERYQDEVDAQLLASWVLSSGFWNDSGVWQDRVSY